MAPLSYGVNRKLDGKAPAVFRYPTSMRLINTLTNLTVSDTANSLNLKAGTTVSALPTALSISTSFYQLFGERLRLLCELGMPTRSGKITNALNNGLDGPTTSMLGLLIETDYALISTVSLSISRL